MSESKKTFRDVSGARDMDVMAHEGTVDIFLYDDYIFLDAATARALGAHLVELADKLEAEG